MLTKEQNERLTQVGPGTPGGELLRRYWQALCPAGEITADNPKKRVRILGEDLVVYRGADGEVVCIAEHCPHRRASLYYGFIEEGGLRCCYHGWKFNAAGRCVERPFESGPGSASTTSVRSYPVQRLGGLFFVYMGPDPAQAPLLPRWDVLVAGGKRNIVVMPIHDCSWLQAQENTVDTLHTYYLHGHMSVLYNLPTLDQGRYFYRPIQSFDWGISRWGIDKSVVYGGDAPELETRPPLIFPNVLRIPEGPIEAMHFRVPVDDRRTRIIWVGLRPSRDGSISPADETVSFEYAKEVAADNDRENLATFYGQDRIVWETQGAIVDRSKENLGASDRGIVMFRRMLDEQIERVERGEAPTVAVITDPNENDIIRFDSATRPWSETDQHMFVS